MNTVAKAPEPGTAALVGNILGHDELRRYARQLVLDEIGLTGQQKLKAARVLVIGCGGLGSPVLLYLAATGVGTLGIVEFDAVDMSNLHRQVLFGDSDIGQSKGQVAAARLTAANPHVNIVLHETRLNPANAAGLITGYDVVVDATDNFVARYIINDASVRAKIAVVSASILRFDAQIAVFDPARGGPCYRCLFPAPPPADLAPSCAEAGVVGVLPGIVGCLQANEVIKLLCGMGAPLVGRLLCFDALAMQFRTFDVARNPSCAACGADADQMRAPGLDQVLAAAGPPEALVKEITVEDLSVQLAGPEAPFLLDVRGESERAIAAIAGSVGIALDRLDTQADLLPRDRTIVCICHKGQRSRKAGRQLLDAGFTDVLSLAGGVDRWAEQTDPRMARY
jgi:sulfur-carrier protein adenylyltransferase/sulfurtransferase